MIWFMLRSGESIAMLEMEEEEKIRKSKHKIKLNYGISKIVLKMKLMLFVLDMRQHNYKIRN